MKSQLSSHIKKHWPLKIFMMTFVSFALSYICAGAGGFNSVEAVAAKYVNNGVQTKVAIEKNFPANGIDLVEIKTTSTNLRVVRIAASEINVKVSGNFAIDRSAVENMLTSTSEGRKLSLRLEEKDPKNSSGFSINIDDKAEVVIGLPASIGKFGFETVSGDMQISDLQLAELSMKGVSGDLTALNGKIDSLNVSTTSGDTEWAGQIVKFENKSVSGDVELKLENSDPNVKSETVSGDFEIKFSKTPDVKVELATTSGDLEVAPELAPKQKQGKSLSALLGAGKGLVAVESVSGDIKIEKNF